MLWVLLGLVCGSTRADPLERRRYSGYCGSWPLSARGCGHLCGAVDGSMSFNRFSSRMEPGSGTSQPLPWACRTVIVVGVDVCKQSEESWTKTILDESVFYRPRPVATIPREDPPERERKKANMEREREKQARHFGPSTLRPHPSGPPPFGHRSGLPLCRPSTLRPPSLFFFWAPRPSGPHPAGHPPSLAVLLGPPSWDWREWDWPNLAWPNWDSPIFDNLLAQLGLA